MLVAEHQRQAAEIVAAEAPLLNQLAGDVLARGVAAADDSGGTCTVRLDRIGLSLQREVEVSGSRVSRSWRNIDPAAGGRQVLKRPQARQTNRTLDETRLQQTIVGYFAEGLAEIRRRASSSS